jgi:hypothetical protein
MGGWVMTWRTNSSSGGGGGGGGGDDDDDDDDDDDNNNNNNMQATRSKASMNIDCSNTGTADRKPLEAMSALFCVLLPSVCKTLERADSSSNESYHTLQGCSLSELNLYGTGRIA